MKLPAEQQQRGYHQIAETRRESSEQAMRYIVHVCKIMYTISCNFICLDNGNWKIVEEVNILWGSGNNICDIVNNYEWFNMKSDMTVFACIQCLSE